MTGRATVASAVAKLQQSLEKLNAATAGSAVAQEKVVQVQANAAQSGFRGVAERLGAVRTGLQWVLGQQATAATRLGDITSSAATVTNDREPQEIVATLAPLVSASDQLAAAMVAVVQKLVRAQGDVAAALQGGQPGQLLAVLEQARQASATTVGSIGLAKSELEQVIATANETGATGGPGSSSTPSAASNPVAGPTTGSGKDEDSTTQRVDSARQGDQDDVKSVPSDPRFAGVESAMLDDFAEDYVRNGHMPGVARARADKSVFNADADLNALVERANATPIHRENDRGFFERDVDAGVPVGRTSEVTGGLPTTWYRVVQDKYGSVITMHPISGPGRIDA